jgi:hypothetical protein
MSHKDSYEESIRFFEEKIKSLYKSYQDLQSSKILHPGVSQDFPLDPSDQSAFRKEIIEKVLEIPSLGKAGLYAHTLEKKSIKQLVNLTSLLSFFKKYTLKRTKTLKFLKYKLILKKSIDKSKEIDFEIHEISKQSDVISNLSYRLSLVNEYSLEGTLKMQDVRLYLNQQTEYIDAFSFFSGYIKRLKWIFISQKHSIWKKYALNLKDLKTQSISRMKLLTSDPNIGKIRLKVQIVTNINAKNLERQREMMKKVQAQHSTFAEEHLNINEELLNSHFSDIDLPPILISTNLQLNALLLNSAQDFNLITRIEDNDFHALNFQVKYLFQELFEVQTLKTTWVTYGDKSSKEKIRKKLLAFPQKLGSKTAIGKKSSSRDTEDSSKTPYKVIHIVESNWTSKIKYNLTHWEKIQEVELSKIKKNDSILENSFSTLDIQNFPAVEKLLEEFSLTYCEKSSKKGLLRNETGDSDEDIKRNYFSNLLSDNTMSQISETEQVSLASVNLKSLYTLKLLKNREMKYRLYCILNVFRSFEKKLNLEIDEFLNISSLDLKKIDLTGRGDKLEVCEDEYYIRDSKDEYIIYSIVLQDYQDIINYLIQLGTWYIEKHEVLLSHNSKQYPPIDREYLMSELLEQEVKYQESKLSLLCCLMEIYDSTISIESSIKLGKHIISLISQRPKLNLSNSYFTQSYWANIKSFNCQSLLFSALTRHFKSQEYDSKYALSKIFKTIRIVQTCINELSLDFSVLCAKGLCALEAAVWEECLNDWSKFLSRKHQIRTPADWNLCHKLLSELFPLAENSELKDSTGNIIAHNNLILNIINMTKLIKFIHRKYLETEVLLDIYERQFILLTRSLNETIAIDWPYVKTPNKDAFPYAIGEIDKSFLGNLDFFDRDCIKYALTHAGISDLLTAAKFEVQKKQTLEISVKINDISMAKRLKKISEIELAYEHAYITKNSDIKWMLILDRKGEGIIPDKVESEIKRLTSKLSRITFVYDLQKIKSLYFPSLVPDMHASDIYSLNLAEAKHLEKYNKVRNSLISGYCTRVLGHISIDSTIIQILRTFKEFNKLFACVPKRLKKSLLSSEDFDKEIYEIPNSVQLGCLINIQETLQKKYTNSRNDLNINLVSDMYYKLTGLLRYTQISLYIALLQIAPVRFCDFLHVTTLEKSVVSEEITDKELYERVIRDEVIKIVIDTVTSIIHLKVQDWVELSKKAFSCLSISLYSILSTSLLKYPEKDSSSIKEMMENLFKYSSDQKNEKTEEFDIIKLLTKYFISNKAGTHSLRSSSGYINELDWGLINTSQNLRTAAHSLASSKLKLETHEDVKQELRLQKLKSIFLDYKAGMSSYSIDYKNCLEVYEDFIFKSSQVQSTSAAVIETLKNYFIGKLCLHGIEKIQNCLRARPENGGRPGLAEFTCNFDSSRTDSTSKIGYLHSFFNCLRNRSSRVETPTAGYALVFYIKDFTHFVRILSENIFDFNESQYFSKTESLKIKNSLLESLLEIKQQETKHCKDDYMATKGNLDFIINNNVTQNGSEIIYTLDSIHRQLREIKENTKLLEHYARIVIKNEFKESLDTKDREIKDFTLNYKSFRVELEQNIQKALEKNVKSGITEIIPYSSKINRKNVSKILNDTKETTKEVNKKKKIQLSNYLSYLRIFHIWAKTKKSEKMEKKVKKLKEKLTLNQEIWEELNHTQRRETLLKQELAHYQYILSSSERVVEELQKEIEDINNERLKLQLYKEKKSKQIMLLQETVALHDKSSESYKYINEYQANNTKIAMLQKSEIEASKQFLDSNEAYQTRIKTLRSSLDKIRDQKNEAFASLAAIRADLEVKNSGIDWKEKYLKLQESLNQSRNTSSRSPKLENKNSSYFPQIFRH